MVDAKNLRKRYGLFYYKDVPFTGEVTGTIQGSVRDGNKHGPWVTYWHDETVSPRIVKTQGTYENGKEQGQYFYYNLNGNLLIEGTYKDGKKDGSWVIYDSRGKRNTIETHKDGALVSRHLSAYAKRKDEEEMKRMRDHLRNVFGTDGRGGTN